MTWDDWVWLFLAVLWWRVSAWVVPLLLVSLVGKKIGKVIEDWKGAINS